MDLTKFRRQQIEPGKPSLRSLNPLLFPEGWRWRRKHHFPGCGRMGRSWSCARRPCNNVVPVRGNPTMNSGAIMASSAIRGHFPRSR